MPASPLHVLIVDDDPELCRFLQAGLQEAGLSCEATHDGGEALETISAQPPGKFDLILLDVGLPTKDGWELLAWMREIGEEVPVIFISGSGSPDERIRGLKLGADDYVVKPFVLAELLARIEAVLRRRLSLAPIQIGDLHIDLARRRTRRAGKPVDLSPKEFDLLLTLVLAQGRVLSRKDLLEDLWDMRFDPGTNILDVHLGRLRRKLDRLGRPAIETVRGAGYRLAVENLVVRRTTGV